MLTGAEPTVRVELDHMGEPPPVLLGPGEAQPKSLADRDGATVAHPGFKTGPGFRPQDGDLAVGSKAGDDARSPCLVRHGRKHQPPHFARCPDLSWGHTQRAEVILHVGNALDGGRDHDDHDAMLPCEWQSRPDALEQASNEER